MKPEHEPDPRWVAGAAFVIAVLILVALVVLAGYLILLVIGKYT